MGVGWGVWGCGLVCRSFGNVLNKMVVVNEVEILIG